MGMDLSLVPINGGRYCYTTLKLDRTRELWPLVRELPTFPAPQPLYTLLAENDIKGTWCEGETQTDAYDSALQCVRASDFRVLREHPTVKERFANRVAWAYLDALPDETPVVLYWY